MSVKTADKQARLLGSAVRKAWLWIDASCLFSLYAIIKLMLEPLWARQVDNMKDKQDNPSGLVVGDVSRRGAFASSLKRNMKPILIGLAVVVVAGGAGVGARILHNKKPAPEIVYPKLLPKQVDDAQNLRANGDDAAAAQVIDKGLADSNTPQDEKYMLYIQQGNIASDKKDYVSAGASYEKAAAIKQTYEIYSLLGNNWRDAGDKAKAVVYYKKALPLINMKNPTAEQEKESLEKLISSLENGTPLENSKE
jgi:tetratricopeptide (TPR) repeat protein